MKANRPCASCGCEVDTFGYVGDELNEDAIYCDGCATPAMQECRICQVCGEPMIEGMTDLGTFYAHEDCFEKAMCDTFGQWRQVEDDGYDGYYEWYDAREQVWQGTGIFYTTWY